MADGIVRNIYYFYDNTDAIEITHQKHIIRYGEVRKNKSLVKAGDKVVRGQVIGYVGSLTTKGIPSMMLHLEMFSNTDNTGTLNGNSIYKRRSDLVDPTPFLDNALL
nr:M23 family metallopeptidase [Acinetobacter pseudolwoffii]